MMNRGIGVWVVVSVVAISALTMSAATIETTLTTDPADMINPDYDTVPIGQDTAETIRQELESSADGEPMSESQTTSEPEPQPSGQEDQMGDGSTTPEPSLLDRLLDVLMYLLAAVAGVTIAAAAVSRRDRLLATLTDLLIPPELISDGTEAGSAWPRTRPSNSIEETWVTLVRTLNITRPESMTPRECEAIAIESGFDEQAVTRLTGLFEEVAYGGRAVSADQTKIAIKLRDQLGLYEDIDD